MFWAMSGTFGKIWNFRPVADPACATLVKQQIT